MPVSAGCLGGCAAGPLIAGSIGTSRAGRVRAATTDWLGPMDAAGTRALARWLTAGGPACHPLPAALGRLHLAAAPQPD